MKDVPRVLLGMLAVALAVGAFALAFSSNPPSPAPATISSEDAAGALSLTPTTGAKGADELTTNAGAMAALSGAFAATLSSTVTPADQPGLPPPTPPAISSAAYQQGMILRRNGDYQNAAKSFRTALAENPDPSSAREIQFRLGESSWLAGDLDGATSAFTALLAQNSDDNLAVRAHYFLSDVFTQRKSYTQAIAELRAYHAQTHTLMGEIDAQIGDLFLTAGNSSQAIAQYDLALHDSTLSSTQRVDFLERIAGAETSLGHPELAATRLGEAFQAAPDNETRAEAEYRWGLALDASKDHATALTHWQHALATYPDQDGGYESLVALLDGQASVDDYQRGLADYYSKSYSPAVLAFNRYIAANPKNSAAALYYEGLAYLENGQTSSAVSTFDALLLKYPNDSRRADALYNKARAYDAATDTDKAVAAYDQFTDLYPTDSRADDSLWKAAQSLHNAGRASDARTQYEKLVAKFPSSPNSAPALFIVGFDYYLSEDYVNAEASWKKVAKLYPGTVDADRASYWLGKLASTQGNSTSAQQYFKQAVTTPHSYYSWRALDLIAPTNNSPSYNLADYEMNSQPTDQAKFEQWLASWSAGGAVSSQLGAAVLNDFHFRRGSELAQLDQAVAARIEFRTVNARFKSDPRNLYALARYYQDNNYFDLSVEAAIRIQALSGVSSEEQMPRYLRALIYPTYFADLIVPYAQRNGVDPALLFALVRQESTYNPLSKSWAGASGLTQVMPETGSGIARDLGLKSFQEGDLLKPYVSVRFGAYFFGQLLRYFDGNIFYALGGYNAGPGNAKKWVRSDVDVGVEEIQLAESSIYVRTVYSQFNEYVGVYRGK